MASKNLRVGVICQLHMIAYNHARQALQNDARQAA
jgi:hypothetical protein